MLGLVTASLSDPTPGWNNGIQGGKWGGLQFGKSDNGGYFIEGGFVSPGASGTRYYVWGPYANKMSDQEIEDILNHRGTACNPQGVNEDVIFETNIERSSEQVNTNITFTAFSLDGGEYVWAPISN